MTSTPDPDNTTGPTSVAARVAPPAAASPMAVQAATTEVPLLLGEEVGYFGDLR
ncbi:hypothetical protein ACTMS0_17715 [Micromonospora sp. H33]|uniref:hypothetical protein n=1 Tax=Micromonospora sp. H33 TaxID=3452215 RepID=UPI003F8BC70E